MCKMIFLNKTYTFCVIHHINCMNLRFRRWCYNLFPLNFEKRTKFIIVIHHLLLWAILLNLLFTEIFILWVLFIWDEQLNWIFVIFSEIIIIYSPKNSSGVIIKIVIFRTILDSFEESRYPNFNCWHFFVNSQF